MVQRRAPHRKVDGAGQQVTFSSLFFITFFFFFFFFTLVTGPRRPLGLELSEERREEKVPAHNNTIRPVVQRRAPHRKVDGAGQQVTFSSLFFIALDTGPLRLELSGTRSLCAFKASPHRKVDGAGQQVSFSSLFFVALYTGPTRPLSLELSDTRSICALNTSPPRYRAAGQLLH